MSTKTDTVPELTPKGRRHERVVSAISVLYHSVERDADGHLYTVIRSARRGETIALSGTEAARLDSLAGLAPAGWTAEDVEKDIEATHRAYLAERQQPIDDGGRF